ncbi:MAG: hypothetical protein FWE19_05140 [Oscillospiraceae bacterium]|nr:hypothetical protein [Oscillospiraceae bacterium]
MNWIYRLERKLGRRFGVTNIMLYITATMLAFYVFWLLIMPGLYGLIAFHRELILNGEFWRAITFVLIPSNLGSPFFVLLSLFIAYRIGNNLEHVWGKTLLNMYLFFGVLGAIIAGFITGFATNYYIFLSLILAFCYMNPNATFLLFFILPVKAKHIALVNWAFYIWSFIQGNFSSRVAIIFSLINFFLFFGPDVWRTMKQNYNIVRRRKQYQKSWGDNNPWR